METDEELAELFGYSLPDDKGSLKIRGFKFLPTYRSDNCDMNLLEQASKVGMKKFLKHEKSQVSPVKPLQFCLLISSHELSYFTKNLQSVFLMCNFTMLPFFNVNYSVCKT